MDRWIPLPRILHPHPSERFYATHLSESRMRRRARTDLCGGRSVMAVPTATFTSVCGCKTAFSPAASVAGNQSKAKLTNYLAGHQANGGVIPAPLEQMFRGQGL